MPVISTAVGAVALAAATTTVATVSAAVVAVSAAIGTLGLAVTAVGMATGNKGLLKAGKIMGYVGLAGSIAGYAAGVSSVGFSGMSEALGNAYREGSGIMSDLLGFSQAGTVGPAGVPGAEVGTKAIDTTGGALNEMAATPSTAATSNAPPSGLLDAVGKGPVLDASGQAALPPGALEAGAGQASAGLPPVPADQAALAAQTQAAAKPVGDQVALAAQTQAAATTPPAGSATAGLPPGQDFSKMLPVNPSQPTYMFPGAAAGPATAGPISPPSWFAALPDYAKYGLMTAGGQGLAGALAGYFPGLAAEEQNNRAWELQRWQQANAAYAPTRSFVRQPVGPAGRTGLINSGRT